MEEWHVSDSEDEQKTKYYTQFIASNLKGLCSTVSNQDFYVSHSDHSSDQLHIPKNLNALYRQIENDGFIVLQCEAEGSKRRLETMKNDTHSINNHTNSPTCNISNETQAAETKDEVSSTVKRLRSEFDYDEEEMMETAPMVRLPRRKQKSEHDKYRKKKRVGTMEKVINNLNRFERLNAQAMAADNVHSSNS